MPKASNKGSGGYDLYAKEARPRVVDGIKASKGGENPKTSNVNKELGRRWDKLPDGTREIWNKKTKK